MSSLTTFKQAFAHLGAFGTVDLVRRKFERRARYKRMMRYLPITKGRAILRAIGASESLDISQEERVIILARAEAMLRDENIFFTFPYNTHGIERPWEFDPIENKYWPIRHYTERHLHGEDTPRDVKIVWEINRFKDLPILGQAALITKDQRFADEVERRLLSWIGENPFSKTINWASALEISIRLLSWTSTLMLLRMAGYDILTNPKIARSIYEQAGYLAGDLSTDKVVPTNHLIGEAAGLFVTSLMWDFPASGKYAEVSRKILEEEILRQTYPDGATREASSWYHQFVTHFFDLAERVGSRSGNPMSRAFEERLANMKTYLSAMTFDGTVVRFGDADDGWAVFFEGNIGAWKTLLFGAAKTQASFEHGFFPDARHVPIHIGNSFLFVRAGEFGMGGAGYSSHAHDDFLSPLVFLEGLPVLIDPGTFVYNGDSAERTKYRVASAHNSLVLGGATGAIPKSNFGWRAVRPSANVHATEIEDGLARIASYFSEWPTHRRYFELHSDAVIIMDRFDAPAGVLGEWMLHLDPQWTRLELALAGKFAFKSPDGAELLIIVRGFDLSCVEPYDFSPSYGVRMAGSMIRMTANNPKGSYEIVMSVNRHPGA